MVFIQRRTLFSITHETSGEAIIRPNRTALIDLADIRELERVCSTYLKQLPTGGICLDFSGLDNISAGVICPLLSLSESHRRTYGGKPLGIIPCEAFKKALEITQNTPCFHIYEPIPEYRSVA